MALVGSFSRVETATNCSRELRLMPEQLDRQFRDRQFGVSSLQIRRPGYREISAVCTLPKFEGRG
jgi:hypothetical protein